MTPCIRCAAPMPRDGLGCPHCGTTSSEPAVRSGAMVLLGLSLTACGLRGGDALYGGPITDTAFVDNDGDGYAEEDGDCDDNDPNIHPDAEETAGDGVDSNCNGEDDT